MKNSKGIFN